MSEQTNIKRRFHSVRLIEDKCKGCVNCIKHCPTEAIRVRDGKAQIIETKCVDCGECIRNCPNQAKTAVADTLERLKDFRYNIALPAPALYGQFRGGIKPEKIIAGLLDLGFDDVFEVAYGAELVSAKIREVLKDPNRVKPLFSSACPAIVRLIQVRFPGMIGNIIPVASPMQVAAKLARARKVAELGLKPEEIGLFFISPCPGKVSAIVDPIGHAEMCIDGAIPVKDVFGKLHSFVYNATDEQVKKAIREASGVGVGWGRSGGEVLSVGARRHISVDGIHNVIQVMEEIDRGKLLDMDYIELQACVGGCVGGVLQVENSFISRRRVRDIATEGGAGPSEEEIAARQAALLAQVDPSILVLDKPIEPVPMLSLDADMSVAIQKMEQIEEIASSLPDLDCGSCGAPNCRALAEDIVMGLAVETDCVFILREKVHVLAQELMTLAEKAPPAMGMRQKVKDLQETIEAPSPETTPGK